MIRFTVIKKDDNPNPYFFHFTEADFLEDSGNALSSQSTNSAIADRNKDLDNNLGATAEQAATQVAAPHHTVHGRSAADGRLSSDASTDSQLGSQATSMRGGAPPVHADAQAAATASQQQGAKTTKEVLSSVTTSVKNQAQSCPNVINPAGQVRGNQCTGYV